MYIQSGEWVIISRVKTQFKFKNKIFKNLRFRIILFMMLAGLLPCAAVLFGVAKFYESHAVDLQTAEIQNQCTILCNQLNTYHYLEDTSSNVINANLTQMATIYNGRVMVIDENLRVVKDTYSLDEGKTDVSENVVRCMKGESSSYFDRGNRYIEVASPISDSAAGKITGVMLATVSTDSIEDTVNVVYTVGGSMIGIVMILLAILSIFLADRVVRPLHRITAAIESVTEGYSDDVLHVDTFTETKQMSEAFNKMLGRLKLLDESREEFVSNVSHELKTPMTSMKVLADSLVGQSGVPEELYQEFMHDITAEIDRENRIITDLLTLVKMDKKTADLQIQHMDINQLLEDILKRLRPIADKRKIDLILDSFRPVEADVDEIKFTSAISNLVENGIKYNVDEGWVRVSLDADHKYFYVTVADSGTGIPEGSLDRIFERFYRVDKSHSREIGGTGLGLAITRSTIAMHHGVIKVFSREGEGTTFSVRIPLSYIP